MGPTTKPSLPSQPEKRHDEIESSHLSPSGDMSTPVNTDCEPFFLSKDWSPGFDFGFDAPVAPNAWPSPVCSVSGSLEDHEHKRSMRSIVRSLKTILGDSHVGLLQDIEQRIDRLNPGWITETAALSLAHSAHSALDVEALSDIAGCPYLDARLRKRSRSEDSCCSQIACDPV